MQLLALAVVAIVSLGRPTTVEFSRRLTGWAYIIFALSILGLCVVSIWQSEKAWRELEILIRVLVGLSTIIAIMIFVGRLRRDDAMDVGELEDTRNDVQAAFRRTANSRTDPNANLYRIGWVCVGIGLLALISVLLTPGAKDMEILESPYMFARLVVGGGLVMIGRVLLGTHKKRKSQAS